MPKQFQEFLVILNYFLSLQDLNFWSAPTLPSQNEFVKVTKALGRFGYEMRQEQGLA